MRRFEFHGGTSEKFWEVERSGTSVTVHFGRIGTDGQTKVKDLDDEVAAQAHVDALVAAKVKKGYVAAGADDDAVTGGEPPASAAARPDKRTGQQPEAPSAEVPEVAEVPGYEDLDEDALVVPAAWRKLVHPIRGLDRVAPLDPDPAAAAAAAALLEGHAEALERVLGHPETDPELAERARRHLERRAEGPGRTIEEDEALGAAVVARGVSVVAGRSRWPEMAAVADAWFLDLGPAHAAAAGAHLGEVFGQILPAGADRRTALLRQEQTPRDLQLITVWPLLTRLRRLLAAVDDATHAEVLVRVAPLRTAVPSVRAVLAYLTPSEQDGLDADVRAHTGVVIGFDDCYAPTITDEQQAAHLLAHASPWSLTRTPDLLTSLAVHVGPAVAPGLVAVIDGADVGADARKLLCKLLAQLPGDEALAALLARADQKHAAPSVPGALARFPRRAGRLLAAAATAEGASATAQATATEALRAHLATHPGLAERLQPELEPASAAVVADLARAEDAVERAPAERVPALLATPPWTARARPAKATVIELDAPPAPLTLHWAPGESEACSSVELGARWLASHGGTWSDQLEALLAGRQGYAHVMILAMAPPAEALAALPEITPTDLESAVPGLRRLLANVGEPALPWVMAQARSRPATVAEALASVEGAEAAAGMAEWLRRLKTVQPVARAWFDRHPEAAARDLIAPALGRRGAARTAAEEALRFLAAQGHGAVVRAQAAPHGPEVVAAVEALLAGDAAAAPARVPALPAWLEPAALPPLLLADRRAALPTEAVGVLLTMLALSKPGVPHPGIAVVRPELDPASLAEVGWAAFEQWRRAGQPAKEAWLLDGLALVGDDETVRRLAPVIRAWPGEGAHARAVAGLDVLAAVGSDVALLHLHGIAEKVRFRGLRASAADKVAEVAAGLGLSTEQLADRLVPDLGLDAEGSMDLDYGPRRFRVGFDERLKPVVFDADGTRRKALPKPGAKDDAATADPAYARFTALKKDVRTIAADQIRRLEWAMVARRRWPAAAFRTFFVDHPLVRHLGRRLVWATFDRHGGPTGSFRVAEDRTLADVQDREVRLDDDAIVGVAHPLHLRDSVAPWAALFADYEILQPFAQLGREVLALTEAERSATVLDRLAGLTVPTGKVLGLASRGWERGLPQDAGRTVVTYKEVPGHRCAVLDLDPGIVAGNATHFEEQVLSTVWLTADHPGWVNGRGDLSFGGLDPISASELLRDLDHLRS